MRTVHSGSTVTIAVPFVDEDGNEFVPTAGTAKLYDAAGTEIVNLGVVTLVPVSKRADVLVDAAHNTLAAFGMKAVQRVSVVFTVGVETKVVDVEYLVSSGVVLLRQVDSFQTYEEALEVSSDMFDLTGWDGSSKKVRCAAMRLAYTRIAGLNYKIARKDDQNRLSPTGAQVIEDLSELTVAEFDDLPAEFKAAVRQAQVVEAEHVLSGDTINAKRDAGIISETIGESSSFYRSGKALKLALSPRALDLLKPYISWSRRIGRA